MAGEPSAVGSETNEDFPHQDKGEKKTSPSPNKKIVLENINMVWEM